MFRPFAKRALACVSLFLPLAAAAGTPGAPSYVQGGLVGHYDGIDNAGTGVHDPDATAWKDLAGALGDGALGAGAGWDGNCWTNAVDGRPVTLGAAFSTNVATKTFTVEMVLKPDAVNVRRTLLGNYSSAQNFNIECYSDARVRCYYNGNPDWYPGATLAAGVTSVVTLVTTPSAQTFYKNGALTATRTGTIGAALTTGTSTIVGGELTRADYAFRGAFYALRVYNRALAADEIAYNKLVDDLRFGGVAFDDITYEDGEVKGFLKVTASGYGSVAVNGAAPDPAGSWFAASGTVALVATPQTGHVFVRWAKANGATHSSEATLSVSPANCHALEAVFLPAGLYDVTVPVNASLNTVKSSATLNGNDSYRKGLFDNATGSDTTRWLVTQTTNAWWSYQFLDVATTSRDESRVRITGYNVVAEHTAVSLAPQAWTIEGSDDGANWTLLDRRTNQTSWALKENRRFAFTNDTRCGHYRFTSITNSGYNGQTSAGEFELYSPDRVFDITANLAYGTPSPEYGRALVPYGVSTNFSVAGTLETYAVDGVRAVDLGTGIRGRYNGYTLTEDGVAGAFVAGTESFGKTATVRQSTVAWNFTRQYLVHADARTGGTLAVGGATGLASYDGWHDDGAAGVTLTAVPTAGYAFMGWGGDTATGESNLVLTVGRPYNVYAIFLRSEGDGSTYNWTGGGDGSGWFDPGNWGGEVPAAGDHAVLAADTATTVWLEAPTPRYASVTLGGGSAVATLCMSNWTTYLNADAVVITNKGAVGCGGPCFPTEMSNRVWIVCHDLALYAGGAIDVSKKGWRGASTTGGGYGPGGGDHDGGGAAHGGAAGHGWGKTYTIRPKIYGIIEEPTAPGSGGGGGSSVFNRGHGGGAVRIDATGCVRLYGQVRADGEDATANQTGGGSGGSILVNCGTFDGTNIVSATGGANAGSARGGGGGGRIAIRYGAAAQAVSGLKPAPLFRCWGLRTIGTLDLSDNYPYGGAGSVYLTDTNFFPGAQSYWTRQAGSFFIPGWTRFKVDSLDLPKIPDIQFNALALDVAGDMTLRDYGRLFVSNCTVTVGGTLTVTNTQFNLIGWNDLRVAGDLRVGAKGTVTVFCGTTNAAPWAGYTTKITAGGTFSVEGAGAKYRPTSHPRTGGGVYHEVGSLFVATNGIIDAASRGWGEINSTYTDYIWGFGPGTSRYTAGASYGGMGGQPGGYTYPNYLRGTYGDEALPILPGSDAGKHWGGYVGGYGGGLVWVKARKDIEIEGMVNANGGACTPAEGGGGAGGGILFTCRALKGGGSITANGGNCNNGGSGGGGRIAFYATRLEFAGTVSVTNGVSSTKASDPLSAYHGKPGTLYTKQLPATGLCLYLK